MAFLRSRDYLPQIQTTILSQLTKGDLLVQADAEEDALVNDYKEQVQYEGGLGELDALPHTFAVAGDLSMGRFPHIDAIDRAPRKFLCLGVCAAVETEEGVDESIAGKAARK